MFWQLISWCLGSLFLDIRDEMQLTDTINETRKQPSDSELLKLLDDNDVFLLERSIC